jgi:predicted enzyme related to lactoylglutathione lyase
MRREQITIYLDQPEADAVRARAKRRGTSIGEAAREVVAAGLRTLAAESEREAAQNEAMR